jgi:hypothetical protein
MATPPVLGRDPLLVMRVALGLLADAFDEYHHLRVE